MEHGNATSGSPGLVLRAAAAYDLLVWLFTHGRVDVRAEIAGLACLQAGESVLDIGCGTGSLALEAKRRVGERGIVAGIDASPEMIARRARKHGRPDFTSSSARRPRRRCPFRTADSMQCQHADGSSPAPHFTRACVREIRRVLRPHGRVLVVDFGQSSRQTGECSTVFTTMDM
jgi:ubiquinone/menaquinone biosynthesis C-methylase UbiE